MAKRKVVDFAVKQGDWVQFKRYRGDTYIVAQVGYSEYALIGLDDGNRWSSPVKMEYSVESFPISTLLGRTVGPADVTKARKPK